MKNARIGQGEREKERELIEKVGATKINKYVYICFK